MPAKENVKLSGSAKVLCFMTVHTSTILIYAVRCALQPSGTEAINNQRQRIKGA